MFAGDFKLVRKGYRTRQAAQAVVTAIDAQRAWQWP
jgi:hypothetical protein